MQQAYWFKDWRRLLLSPLHHADDWHLYFNMVSFLWKGRRLEQRLGGPWFLYLLSVFSLLTGLVYLVLEALLTELMQDQSYSMECAVGFSGINYRGKFYNPLCCNWYRRFDHSIFVNIYCIIFLHMSWPTIWSFFPEMATFPFSCVFIFATFVLLGVLFALKVLNNHYYPGSVTYVMGLPVSSRYASWVELVLIHITSPGWVTCL